MDIKTDDLAYWYLRLNGFLTTVNFVVHPDTGASQRTDVDILGVRFPHRAELLLNSMVDDRTILKSSFRPFMVIAEAKKGLCNLNGPWTNPNDENMERVLRAIGLIPIHEVNSAAKSLYQLGFWENEDYLLSLLCFGGVLNKNLTKKYPNVPQITWDEVLQFIFKRFLQYRREKASHPQWNEDGQNLWETVLDNRDYMPKFIDDVNITF